jgi:hypothetical protein
VSGGILAASTVSLDAQIACVKREIAMRLRVFLSPGAPIST